ncbi:hypothetical protein [Glycomyces artemisiae]|uniref:Uncharacterized protein n=1 Tax=Glycomyces artemisiae TaxID=1076443 RepID=A0A2T0UL98_9ACTN|nr:hypothetical protein [Glycomyces artemisiae]PRY58666.1 hypothetical protein B0I28_105381 [Glycomyces artemisiae]
MTAFDRRQFHRTVLAVPAAALAGAGLGALATAAAAAAPADWDAHFLVGQANGELRHRRRRGDGSMGPTWDDVPTAAGTLYRVSCTGLGPDLHVVAALNSGTPDHAVRHGADGSWTEFTPIPSQAGPATGAVHVAAAALNSELHVFGASEGGTALQHTVRAADGTWLPRWSTLRTFATISQIATTRVGTTIDTAVVSGGVLRHAIRRSDGTWTGWGNIETSAGDIGYVNRVALAGIGSQLHVVALNGSGEVYHAVRRADATWQQFRRATVLSQYRPFDVAAANVGGEMQVGIVNLDADGGQSVKHTIRRADGSWQTVATVSSSNLTAPGTISMGATPIGR